MNKEDYKAAFLILEAAEQGRPVEFAAQFLASYIVSGDINTSTSLSFLSAVLQRTDELMSDERLIWESLLPGQENAQAPHFVVTEFTEGLGERLTGVDRENLIPQVNAGHKPDNVVLTFDVIVKPDEQTSLFAAGCEFFVDEHGFQWIKFVPSNGYDRDKEHMFRVDNIWAVVRDNR